MECVLCGTWYRISTVLVMIPLMDCLADLFINGATPSKTRVLENSLPTLF